MEIKERIAELKCISVANRYSPIPRPYTLLIRERFNDDGTVDIISKKRIYSFILGGSTVIDEPV